ncbi:MAG: hypothetical protein IPI61_02420 [Syntrophaceae bacterium]|jgi:hypothetical protein|nr:hypothetical protein [Syntrophaceae bacterium]OPX99591.1 MAG: hypothetical protein A4E59_00230 [Syntrophorhabdus sp. PtaB.Bin027]
MIKDREQKAKILRYCAAKEWFPQLEVGLQPIGALKKISPLVTDLDVVASIQDDFEGVKNIVFDCKTKSKESPVNRALWLRGVLDRFKAGQGFCILRRGSFIELDHRLSANKFGIILLSEDEFDLFADVTSRNYKKAKGHICSIDAWDMYLDIGVKYTKLQPVILFNRSGYWMIEDAAEACRKTLSALISARPELDPSKVVHSALILDLAALFSRSLAIILYNIFKAYLHPGKESDLSDALRMMLYGGRDAYDYRNTLYKKYLQSQRGDQFAAVDLSMPEWDRFIQLIRQLLDSPTDAPRIPLILRELSFAYMVNSSDYEYARQLCSKSPQAARFAVLVVDYLCRAGKLPPEFQKIIEGTLLSIQPS